MMTRGYDKLRYCRRCVMPCTKPFLTFDENGVCEACRQHDLKKKIEGTIDWRTRAEQFVELVREVKARNAPYFDALVPVSGGKDSITQVHRLLDFDLRILAVNVDYGIKTEIGIENLARVPEMGANLTIYRPELELHRRLIRLGFEDFGDPDLLSHALLYSFPLHLALSFQIPLVLLGENAAFEYGGDRNVAASNRISHDWFAKFVANDGRDASFISREYDIPMDRLKLYDYPREFEAAGSFATFLSYYYYWDSEENLDIARRYGFKSLPRPSEGTYRNYVGIDEKINRIHQYMKVLKFGYGRATDHACEDIRNDRLSREDAKELVREHDMKELSEYYVSDFLEFAELTRERFDSVMTRYRNPELWREDNRGNWYIVDHLED